MKVEVVEKTMGCLAFVGFISFLMYLYNVMWLKPERLREKLRKQGIRGPPPSLFGGNVHQMKKIQSTVVINSPKSEGDLAAHDYTWTLFPYFQQWRNQYGPIYMYSTGNRQHLYVNDPNLVKEMNLSFSWDLGKPLYVSKTLGPMLGNGILRSNGHVWAHQRKIIAPHFFMDKVKGMVGLMVESALPLLKTWEEIIESKGGVAEIIIDEDLRNFSADVISRVCFGSSYCQGKEIFSKLRSLQKTMSHQSFLFGISIFRVKANPDQLIHHTYAHIFRMIVCWNHFNARNLPNKSNREIWRLEREIESLILRVVKEHKGPTPTISEKDLLHMIMEGANNDNQGVFVPSTRFIVDNCKNIYFAGHETTAVAATWCLMLLALHPEWQDRIRAEVVEVCCGHRFPDVNALQKMKLLKMVIQETLRLYSPAPFVSREVLKETKIGDVVVPKGIHLWTVIPTLHRDLTIWGPDANNFKPERFANGIFDACKLPQVYVPFGVGTRLCLGQNFAMVELKIILSLILSNFSFSLSSKYYHSPVYRMIVEPGHGVHLLIKKL